MAAWASGASDAVAGERQRWWVRWQRGASSFMRMHLASKQIDLPADAVCEDGLEVFEERHHSPRERRMLRQSRRAPLHAAKTRFDLH